MSNSFLEYVDKLTLKTSGFIDHDQFGLVRRHGKGLLTQLQDAVSNQIDSGHSQQGFASKMPVNVHAFDLLTIISAEIFDALSQVTHARPYSSLQGAVRLWSAATTGNGRFVVLGREVTSLELVKQWCARIESLFDPPIVLPIPGECPQASCKATRVVVGDSVSSAVSLMLDRSSKQLRSFSCAACGAAWSAEQLVPVAILMGYEPDSLAVQKITEDGVVSWF